MNRLKPLGLALALGVAAAGAGRSSESLYDEKADAHQQVAAAISEASRAGKNIVLVFGANWCPDCHALDAQMQKPELAGLIKNNFVIVKIDVGRFDRNLDLAEKYDLPLKRGLMSLLKRTGIPALAVLDPHGKLRYSDGHGFADARNMSYESIRAFFDQWKPKAQS